MGYEIDKKKINLKDSIKSAGIFDVEIKVHTNVTTNIKVEIKPE